MWLIQNAIKNYAHCAQEKKLENVRRIWSWMCGVTKMDGIRNERIRGTTKRGEISKKVQERRLFGTWTDS